MRQYGRLALVGAAMVATVSSLLPGMQPTATAAVTAEASYDPDPDWWVTNGRVTDILTVGDRVYIAGGFDYVGPSTGYGVAVDSASGERSSSWPVIDGPIDASVPDGNGGWYIAGRFTRVGGVFRPGAAQVTATGAVTTWNPKPKGGTAVALATTPSAVILGGDFTRLGTTPVARIAAVDPKRGKALPSFALTTNAPVRSLVTDDDVVYAGGDFTVVNGKARSGLLKADLKGAVDESFTGEVRGSVKALGLSGDGSTLYTGGEFTSVATGATTVSRSRLAAFDTGSGKPSTWAPVANGAVDALAVDPVQGTVFVGGPFTSVAGITRLRLAGVSPAGVATTFNPGLTGCHERHTTGYTHTNPPCTTEVTALTVDNGVLYVGGRFGRSGSVNRHDAAAYVVRTGALTDWNPTPGDRVNTLAVSRGVTFLGGEFTSVNGLLRKGVAALDASTGEVDPTLTADTNDMVLDLALSSDGTRLYLAGSFTTVQGQPRSRLASVLLATGVVDPQFRPAFDNDVFSIAYAQGSLYAGGQFTKVSGLAYSHVAKLSGTTGEVATTFRADTVGPEGALRGGGMVESLVVSPDATKVYLAGPFLTVNGRSMPGGLAVVHGSTGAIYPKQLGGVKGCATVGPWVKHLYLSDDGQRLYGGDVCPDYIYRWDAVNLGTTANPTGLVWRTWCNGGMQGVLEIGTRFYFGGHGSTCQASPTDTSKQARQRFAVFDVATGALEADNPTFNSALGIWAVGSTSNGLLFGGDFTDANGTLRQGLAFMPFTS